MSFDLKTIAIIGMIVYVLYLTTNHKGIAIETAQITTNGHRKYVTKENVKFNEERLNQLIEDITAWEEDNQEDVMRHKINSNFSDVQFHQDYRDVITAIQMIVPTYRQLFNIANRPLTYSEPHVSEARPMVKNFVKQLNHLIITSVNIDVQTVDGWEKVQMGLGRPTLYQRGNNKPSPVTLVHIPTVQKYATEDEVKYTCRVIVGKKESEDQMIIKISFVENLKEINDENNFFSHENPKPTISIEQIHIEGMLLPEGKGTHQPYNINDTMFHLDDMEGNQMTNPDDIIKTLQKHRQDKFKEMMDRNAMLDDEGGVFDMTAYNEIDKTASYLHTQTIFDDFQKKRLYE